MININNFKLIAHRGLLEGPSKELENSLILIKNNFKKYPFIINEIDIWIEKKIFFGHEISGQIVEPSFLIENSKNLILHIKNIDTKFPESIELFKLLNNKCHIYAHDSDNFTITNKGWIWSHPKLGMIPRTICVMPETFIDINSNKFLKNLHLLSGVCTDFPIKILDLKYINL